VASYYLDTFLMKLFIVLAALVAFACASNVITLTGDTFDQALEDNQLLLVEFYAPWCGHCKKLAPEYETAADTLAAAGDVGKLAKVDCTEEQELAQRFGIRGYPTLKLFVGGNGAAPKEFNGERTADGIVSYLRKKAEPAVFKVDSVDALNDLIAKDGSIAVLYSDDSSAAASFEKVGADLESFTFAQVADAAVAEAMGAATGKIVLYRDFSESNVELDAGSDAEAIKSFVNDNGFPPVVEIGQESYQRLSALAKPVLVFVNDDAETDKEEWHKILNEAAEQFPTISFTWGPKAALGRAVEAFGGTGTVFPTIIGMKTPALNDADGNPMQNIPQQFSIAEDGDLTRESLLAFAASVADGSVQPFKKSEPVPEDNSGPVTVLVHKNFDEYVKEGNGVFVKFYAPWCGHCKSLAPVWEELGEAFAANNNVVIAKMDATANFVPERFDVKGFPTLVWIGADGTDVVYDGERTLEALSAFVSEKAGSAPAHDEL
jgi:protein disulfide-isomerase A1